MFSLYAMLCSVSMGQCSFAVREFDSMEACIDAGNKIVAEVQMQGLTEDQHLFLSCDASEPSGKQVSLGG